jgi:fructose-1,6-bisphosphatase/inositol monophosphatase family enzyme
MITLGNKEIDLLGRYLKTIGQELLERWEGTNNVYFKEDSTYLTDSDLIANDRLHKCLPYVADYPVYSEETTFDYIPNDCWLIDPINGTGAYVAGIPTWAISVALLSDGVPVFGMIYFPVFNKFLHSSSKSIMLRNVIDETGENFICVSSDTHSDYIINYRGKTRSLGSCCASLYFVARGKADFALLSKPKYWDYAAGIAILRQGGGDVYYLNGDQLDLQKLLEKPEHLEQPVIAVHEALKNDIKKIISYRL